MKTAILLSSLMLAGYAAAADDIGPSAKNYASVKNYLAWPQSDPGLLQYLKGLGDGIWTVSLYMEANHSSPLFCPPEKMLIDVHVYKNALDLKIKEWKVIAPGIDKDWTSHTDIAYLLLEALRETFPCKK